MQGHVAGVVTYLCIMVGVGVFNKHIGSKFYENIGFGLASIYLI